MVGQHDAHRHIDEAFGDDPRVALVAVRRLLDEDVPWLERRAVRLARSSGRSWAKIGRALHRSRQTVRERFGPLDGSFEAPPHRPVEDGRRMISGVRQRQADARRLRELSELEAAGDDVIAW